MSKPALDIKQTLAEYKYDGIIIINITIIIITIIIIIIIIMIIIIITFIL